MEIIKKHYEPLGFTITKVSGTGHWNVLRLYDPSENKYYIAKGIIHIEGNNEMGPELMNKSYNNEKSIIADLPDWWGLELRDAFIENPLRIIVTNEIPNCKWSEFRGNDSEIAEQLYKQIEWLHSNGIAHNDLELKNVLLTCDSKKAIIIDFEKASRSSKNINMREDYRKIISNLKESKSTHGIGKVLEKLALGKLPIIRRHSIGGYSKKHKTRKARKSRKNLK